MVDEKYLQTWKNVKVLGENFLNGFYIVIFEADEKLGEFACG